MQWLIDIIAERVIATIGIPPVFIYRGNPAAEDYTTVNFTIDAAVHTLDLSAIVPANAKGIVATLGFAAGSVNRWIKFFHPSATNEVNQSVYYTLVAAQTHRVDMTVNINATRELNYRINAAINYITFTVKGWWF